MKQLNAALQPALHDVSVTWGDEEYQATAHPTSEHQVIDPSASISTVACTQVPSVIPPVISGSCFCVHLLIPAGVPLPERVVVAARTTLGPRAVELHANNDDHIFGEVLHKIAANARIRDLEGELSVR